MGAQGSTPKTVHIDNPRPRQELNDGSIEVSVEVAQRLQDARKDFILAQNNNKRANLNHEKDILMSDVQVPEGFLNKSADEVEKQQYKETKKKLDRMYGKPIRLPEEDIREIKQMRKNLLLCYKHNPRESLRCNPLSEAFQTYVYKEQLNYLIKLKNESDLKRANEQKSANIQESGDDSGDTLKKPVIGQCGAKKGSADETRRSTGIKVSGDCKEPSDLEDVTNVWTN